MKREERELLEKYFPALSDLQWNQLEALPPLYHEWNSKINVISRKDIDNVVVHHILHSLSIALFTRFQSGTIIYDIGTGGGFPGIPLAVLFPDCRFTLIDSVGKKVRVAQEIAEAISLKNVDFLHTRAEDLREKCHFIVSRAALSTQSLVSLGQKLIHKKEQLNALPNGIIALKGGDLTEELKPFRKLVSTEEISQYLPEIPYFEEKKIIYLPI